VTPKRRWLAALRLEPLDRLPFWPKLNANYPGWQRSPFSKMELVRLHRWVGSDQHRWCSACVREVRKKTSLVQEIRGKRQRWFYHTPSGTLTAEWIFDEVSGSWHPREFPVKKPEDIEILNAFFSDCSWEPDNHLKEEAEQQVREIGEEAVVATGIGTSPLMDWLQHLSGIENGHYLLADEPEMVRALFQTMHRSVLRRTEMVVATSPADLCYITENTSTTLISPAQYQLWNKEHVRAYAACIRSAGKIAVLHMCGKLKSLLPDLNEIPVHGFEAFTSPPVGDTTLLDGRTFCPEKCLLGGTNATLWLQPARRICQELEKDLQALPHHRGLVITSAGVMPPGCSPETIKQVADFVRSFPARF